MAQQTVSKMERVQTVVEWLDNELSKINFQATQDEHYTIDRLFEHAKQMENDRRKEDIKMGYHQGYLDAQCNHVNDADTFVNEQNYLNDEDITH